MSQPVDDPQKRPSANFRANAFDVSSVQQAMAISLTPLEGATTDERWQRETRYHVEDIGRFIKLGPESRVLDYGCGPGRMSKSLGEAHGCRAIGVETSRSMALIALEYVLSENFTVWSPAALGKMVEKGYRFDLCICLWVLQHVYDVQDVAQRIHAALHPGGLLYAVNQTRRCVPTDLGWVHDGSDLRADLARNFTEIDYHAGPSEVFPAGFAERVMIQVLRKD